MVPSDVPDVPSHQLGVGGVGGAAHLLELSLQLSDGVGFVRQQLL